MESILKKPLSSLSDDEVFDLLNSVSEEVKRRNGLMGPTVTDVKGQPLEKTVGAFLGALADFGVQFKNKPGV